MTVKVIIFSVLSLTMIILVVFYSYVRLYYFVPKENIIFYLPHVGVGIFLTNFLVFLFTKNKKLLIFPVVFLVMILLSIIICENITKTEYDKVFFDGTKIGKAIEKYHSEKGYYPDTLKKLVPDYLIEIPKIKTKWNNSDFEYYVGDNSDSYSLYFESYYFDGKGWLQFAK